MSASAPAGNARTNIGRLLMTCTRDTASGSGLRLVMSQPEAAEDTHPPTLETMVAAQMTRKVGWRKGLQEDMRAAGACAAGVAGWECDSLIGLSGLVRPFRGRHLRFQKRNATSAPTVQPLMLVPQR